MTPALRSVVAAGGGVAHQLAQKVVMNENVDMAGAYCGVAQLL